MNIHLKLSKYLIMINVSTNKKYLYDFQYELINNFNILKYHDLCFNVVL